MASTKRALFVMPPFSLYAGRQNWQRVEEFYNPMGFFERVCLVSLFETDPDVPRELGSLRIYPLTDVKPRPWTMMFGSRVYRALDPVVQAVQEIACKNQVDLLVQRFGSPIAHGLPVIWAAQALQLPSIISILNDYSMKLRYEYTFLRRIRRKAFERLVWPSLLANPTAFWSLSRFLTSELIAQGVAPERVVTIPNKESIGRFTASPLPETVRGTLDRLGLQFLREGTPTFLSVGRLIAQKNYPRMIAAFAHVAHEHRDLRYVIVGQGRGESAIRRLLEQHNIQDRVHLVTEYQSIPELQVLYHNVTALLFCSLFEGQGRVVFEAMACGTPVIGSDLGPIPEMIETERNGLLVDPFDVGAITNALRRFLNGELSKPAMRRACVETAKQFDVSQLDPQEAKLYHDVLAGKYD